MKSANNAQRAGKKPYIWNTPKGFVMILLVVLLALAGAYSQTYRGLINAGVSVVAAVLIDMWVGLMQKRKRLFPDGAIITGLIVALVLSYMEPWYIVSATSMFAIVSKHALRVNRKPFFNPAAFGLLSSTFLFSSGEDWWGSLADLPLWSVGILGVGGFIIAQKANKFPQVFSFLGTYFTILLMVGLLHKSEVMELYQPPFVNAILFLSFIMITDPPTSPSKYSGQIWFGFAAAILSIVWNFTYGGTSFLLVGLLCVNLLHVLIYAVQSKKKKTSAQIRM